MDEDNMIADDALRANKTPMNREVTTSFLQRTRPVWSING